MIETRILTVEDAQACAELREEALLSAPEAFAVTYREEAVEGDFMGVVQERLLSRDAVTVGGFYEGNLAGTAMLLKKPLQKMQHKADIEAMYVAEKYRGRGIGTHLMRALLYQAWLWEVEQLQLAVVSSNLMAKTFYQSFGFQTFGIETQALKTGGIYQDEEYMALFL